MSQKIPGRLVTLAVSTFILTSVAQAQTPIPAPAAPAKTDKPTTPTTAPAQTPPSDKPATTPAAPTVQTPTPVPASTAPVKPAPAPFSNRRPMPQRPKPVIARAPRPHLPQNVVAQVNGQNITRDQLYTYFARFGGQPLVQQLIQYTMIEREAKRLGVVVPAAELSKAVTEIKNGIAQQEFQKGNPIPYTEVAARDGITDALIEWSARRNLLIQKTYEKVVSNSIKPLDDQIKIAHIIVTTLPTPASNGAAPVQTPDEIKKRDTDAKAKADSIYADITSGKISFEAAAAQYSDDKATGANGGVLRYFTKADLDRLSPEFEAAAFKLDRPGKVVGPVKTDYGYHIIKLVERGKDATPAERSAYRQELMDAQTKGQSGQALLQRWMEGMLRSAVIVFNPNAALAPTAKKSAPAPAKVKVSAAR